MRSYVVEFIEKVRGNIDLVVEMYYNDFEVGFGSNENRVGVSSKLVFVEGVEFSCFS